MTSAFVDVTSHLDPGWSWQDRVGYVIHKGTVYLTGRAYNSPGSVGQTILAGLPSEVRPTGDVSVTLYLDPAGTDDTSQDTAIAPQRSYAATVTAGGTLKFAAPVPAEWNTAPSAATYYSLIPYPVVGYGTPVHRYGFPLNILLTLVCSWPIDPVSDTYPTELLGPYVGSDFTNVNAEYSPDGERVHLSGFVAAQSDGATRLLGTGAPSPRLPLDAVGGLDFADERTYATIVSDGGQKLIALVVASAVGFGFAELESDLIKPAGQPPPLSDRCPPFGAGHNNNYVGGATFQGDMVATFAPMTPGPFAGTLTIDLPTLLGYCQPEPPWFMLNVSVDSGQNGFPATDQDPFSFTWTGGLPAYTDQANTVLNGTAATPPTGDQVGEVFFDAWLGPTSPQYVGNPFCGPAFVVGQHPIPGNETVWTNAQAHALGTIILTLASTFNFTSGATQAKLQARIVPLYERREWGPHAGDYIDLAGAGWPGVVVTPPPPGPTPGDVQTGEQPQGIRAFPTRHPQRPYR